MDPNPTSISVNDGAPAAIVDANAVTEGGQSLTNFAAEPNPTGTECEEHKEEGEESRANQSTEIEDEEKKVIFRVKQIRERPDRISPILVDFPTRYNPCEVDPETGENVYETPKVMVYRHKSEPKIQVVISPPGANVEYVGTNEPKPPGRTGHAIAIVNREAKTIRILPVAYSQIIQLDTYVKPQPVNEEPNIPPHNASALTPQEAYPLENIIEEEELDSLQDIYRLLQQEPLVGTDDYPVFVRNRLHKLRLIENDSQKKTLCAVASLVAYMIKFKDMYSEEGSSSRRRHKFPGMIEQKCYELFKYRFPRTDDITPEKTDLLIRYVLVLALHVDNFKTDPKDIAKDLRISLTDLKKHFQSLGCKLSWDKNVVVATLPTPLNFFIKSNLQKKRKHKGGRR